MRREELTTERQREARRLREAGLTFTEIGERLGVSRQRAQQAAYPAADRERQARYRETLLTQVMSVHP